MHSPDVQNVHRVTLWILFVWISALNRETPAFPLSLLTFRFVLIVEKGRETVILETEHPNNKVKMQTVEPGV